MNANASYRRYFTWFKTDNAADMFENYDLPENMMMELNATLANNKCIYQSIIQLWETGLSKDVRNLTRREILDNVNEALKQKCVQEELESFPSMFVFLYFS